MPSVQHSDDATGALTRFNAIGFGILLVFLFLLPIFFIPGSVLSLPFAKSVFIQITVVVVFTLYIISALRTRSFTYPHQRWFLVVPVLLIVYLLVSLMSGAPLASMIGYGFEVTSFAFLFVLCILLFLVSTFFATPERIVYTFLAVFAGFVVLALFHGLRFLFGSGVLALDSYFPSLTATPVGQWTDLSVFFASVLILSYITLEYLSLKGVFRWIVQFILILSVVLLIIVSDLFVWIALSLLVLAVAIASLLRRRSGEREHGDEGEGHKRFLLVRGLSLTTIILLVITVGIVSFHGPVTSAVSQYIGIQHTDVRPSWAATYTIAERTLSNSPLFGAGPNQFRHQWASFKPVSVNRTQFWDTEFRYGVGLMPTFVITTGVLGAVAWLMFLGVYLWWGIRSISTKKLKPLTRYLLLATFSVSSFLWFMSFFYVPNAVIFTYTFVFTGLFVAALKPAHGVTRRTVNFRTSPVTVFAATILLVCIVGANMLFIYTVSAKAIASHYLYKVTQHLQRNEIGRARFMLNQAVSWDVSDIYYRTLARANLQRVERMIENANGDQLNVDALGSLRRALQDTIAAAQQAVAVDHTNYRNWFLLGRVYHRAASVGVKGAYSEATDAYKNAAERNPTNPEIPLQRARLEIVNDDLTKARSFIRQAREMKPNYTEAIFLLAQLEIGQGNLEKAINNVRQAVVLSPNNAGFQFQLGLLLYADGRHERAAHHFSRAVSIEPDYANARYYLGLSYSKLDKRQKAIEQFQRLIEKGGDTEQVQTVLQNLKAGRAPYAGREAAPMETEEVTGTEDLPVDGE